jgi:hypothetical protein
MPLDDTDQTTLKGQLQLGGVDLKLRPDLPLLAGTRGRIDFDQPRPQLAGMTARLLGGEAGIEGGSQRDGGCASPCRARPPPTACAARPSWAPSRLAQAASGQAAYRFQLAGQGRPERAQRHQQSAGPGAGPAGPGAQGGRRGAAAAPADDADRQRPRRAAPGGRRRPRRCCRPSCSATCRRQLAGAARRPRRAGQAARAAGQRRAAAGQRRTLDLDAWQQRLGALAGGHGGGGR